MLVAPLAWYELVPGVTDTGFFNQHFIRDIGIIQLFIGIAFGWGLIRPEYRIGLWAAATLWLGAHAAFHLWEVAVGICSPSVILRDFPAVACRRSSGRWPLSGPSVMPTPNDPHSPKTLGAAAARCPEISNVVPLNNVAPIRHEGRALRCLTCGLRLFQHQIAQPTQMQMDIEGCVKLMQTWRSTPPPSFGNFCLASA